MKANVFSLLLLPLLGTSQLAGAQATPDAGTILRETTPIAPKKAQRQGAPLVPEIKNHVSQESIGVRVNAFRFDGNSSINSAELSAVLADHVGQDVSLHDLHGAAAKVGEYYLNKGMLARVYLPRQEITDGVVKIAVVEAVYGGVQVVPDAGNKALRTPSPRIERGVSGRQKLAENVAINSLERSLLLTNDWSGLEVSGSLAAGSKPGESELIVRARDTNKLSGSLAADNYGSRSTGEQRLNGKVDLNAPFGYGEQLGAQWLLSDGVKLLRAKGAMPIGYDGLTFSADATYLDYQVTHRDFDGLGLKGDSVVLGAELAYPIIRANLANLYASARVERKQFGNESKLSRSSDYDIEAMTLGINGNRYDNYGKGGSFSAGLDVVVGTVDYSADNPNAVNDGSFSVGRYWLSRYQQLAANLSVTASLTGQRASEQLDSAEQFSLGGAYSMAAYPVNEGRGSEGDLINISVDWQTPLACNCVLTALLDAGVVQRKNARGQSINDTYKGAGLRFTWRAEQGWYANATVAQRLGNNPFTTATGKDQNGSRIDTPLWVSIGKTF